MGAIFRRDVRDRRQGICALARDGQHVGVDIRGEDLHVGAHVELAHRFGEHHRDGVGFFPARTAGHPDPQVLRIARLADQRVDHEGLECVELRLVAKEAGDVDQQIAEQGAALRLVLLHASDIVLRIIDPQQLHTARDAAGQGGALVAAEIVAHDVVNDLAQIIDMIEDIGRLVDQAVDGRTTVEEVAQLLDDLAGLGHDVDKAGRNRRHGHPVVAGGLRVLRHRDAAKFLDRAQAATAIGPGPRQDDASGPAHPVLGQALEEVVDGPAHAARIGEFGQMKHAIRNREAVTGGNDVDLIGLDPFTAFGLPDIHDRITLDQLRHQRLVGGIKVLDHDKGQIRLAIVAFEHFAEGFQTPGRSTDPDDGDVVRRPHDLTVIS